MSLKPSPPLFEIPEYLIPIIIGLFIWITFNFAITDRRLKFFAMAYLKIFSDSYKNINYQKYWCDFMFKKPDNNNSLLGIIEKCWGISQRLIKPFLLIYLFGLFLFIKVLLPITEVCAYFKEWYYIVLYLSSLALIHLLIIGKLVVLYTNDFESIENQFTSIHENNL